MVERFGICPFAEPALKAGGVARRVLTNAEDARAAIDELAGDTKIEVALLIFPSVTMSAAAFDRWCAPLVSGQMIKWTDFVTNCYTGGTPQNALTAGTMLQQGSVLVPGLQTDLPFDICLTDIQITP